MLSIESALIGFKGILHLAGVTFHCGSGSDAAVMQLFPALADAYGFPAIRSLGAAQFRMNQPDRLAEKSQQQQPGKKLRTSEAFAREIWTHKVEPSVLPCRRQFAGKVLR